MNTSPADPAPAVVSLPADTTAPGSARRLLDECSPGDTASVALDDVALALSELVANAVEHGAGEVVEVRIRSVDPGGMELTVGNKTPRRLPRRPWLMPAPEADRGRGLAVVASLASQVEVEHDGDRLRIRVVIGDAAES